MLMPAMIGGFAFGALAGIPIVSCLCCALMAGAGFLAAFLYSKQCKAAGVEFRPGQGALLGLFAAPFYAIAASVVGGLFQMVMPTDPEQIDEIVGQIEQADLPPEVADAFTKFLEAITGGPGAIVIGFLMSLFFGLIFVTLGGLIGGAVFRTQPVIPTPPPPMPSPPLEPPPPPPHMPSV
jgi:hypothetical protein